jgi:hypothetical protein
MPRRSILIRTRALGASPSQEIASTRKPSRPRIRVHSRRDSMCPPRCLTTRQNTMGLPNGHGSRSRVERWARRRSLGAALASPLTRVCSRPPASAGTHVNWRNLQGPCRVPGHWRVPAGTERAVLGTASDAATRSAELDQVVKEFRIDSLREYLTSYSMGAAGTRLMEQQSRELAATSRLMLNESLSVPNLCGRR